MERRPRTEDRGPEAGSAEAGSAEAGSAEAGSAEAGSADAGSADAGSADAGVPDRVSVVRRVAIGCFTSWLGFVSGAMVAALLSKFTAFVTKARDCDGIPSCNWYVWAGIGGIVGAVTLPVLVLWVLGRPVKPGKETSVQGEF